MNDSENPLSLSSLQMRDLGYQVIDIIVDHFDNLREKKVLNSPSNEALSLNISADLPIKESDPAALIEFLREQVFKNIMHTDHPRFFSFIPSASNYISVLSDALAIGHNVFAGHWMAGASAAEIETITIDWLKKLCGFPKKSGGIFTSGGSMANLMAIVTAKKVKINNHENGVVYYSSQTHSSVSKALRILGFDNSQMRPIGINSHFQMEVDELELCVKRDLKNGLLPICIIGNAGTTNTGAVDPLSDILRIAHRYNLWFHIDGAYGAAAILTEKGKELLLGMEEADSITLDPHKWWFQPYEIGCLLVKNKRHLRETFGVSAEYLQDAEEYGKKEINYYDYGPQLTRSFRALKLYSSLKVFGLDNFKRAVEKGIEAAEFTESLLKKNSGWKIISKPQLGIINFVFHPDGMVTEKADELAKAISTKMAEDGYALVTTTSIKGRTVLRMCPIHPGVNKEEIKNTVNKLDKFVKEIS